MWTSYLAMTIGIGAIALVFLAALPVGLEGR